MSKCVGYEPCPKCVARGNDRRGDNLGVYSDGSGHCFSCHWHRFPKRVLPKLEKEKLNDETKAVLPYDFTREVPTEGWKWLLKYGLSYSYWKKYVGYSPSHHRLVLTFGEPIKFSIGRALKDDERKWRIWGDKLSYVQLIGENNDRPIVLVEDLISAHKVGQVAPTLCLFGTQLHDPALTLLIKENRPVILWLDKDQYPLLSQKINRLQSFINHPVKWISTDKDPKEYDTTEIRHYLDAA